MKKRICSLLLALCLLCGLLVLPAEATTAQDAYGYLKAVAMAGSYYPEDGYWGIGVELMPGMNYGIYFNIANENVELSIFNEYQESTIVLTKEMKTPYYAYSKLYSNFGEATFNPAAYTPSTNLSFYSYKGDASEKTDTLYWLNRHMPDIVELTGVILHEGGYSIKDLGFTSFNRHNYHLYDRGRVIRQPSCGYDGIALYTCEVCGATVTEQIPATGNHTWNDGEVLREPSCVKEGKIRYTCTVCAATKDERPPALGHAWTVSETVTEGETAHETAVRYACSRCNETKDARLCAAEIFTDMPADDNFAHDPIDWAYFHEPQITAGTTATTFSPKNTCTRGQVVTFLWRAVGEPKPENAENPFEDVKEGAYYYDAVLWAVDQGVTTGASPTTFNPNGKCTRGQVVTFLWRAAGEPSVGSDIALQNPFEDVRDDAYYYNAVLWAVNAGVTTGTGPTAFNPGGKCTRAQVVTFLSRAEEALTSRPTEPDDPGTPPEYFTAQSVEELLAWVNAEPADEQQPFESFLTAARRLGSVPTAASASDELSLKQILVTGGYDRVEYFFGKDEAEKPEFEVLLELPGTEEEPKPSLDERMAQINAELAEEFELWQYVKSSATADGAETAIWTCDGGEYAKKDSEDKELIAPTAFFEWQGCLVIVRGVGDLYGTKWDDAYLAQFTLSLAALK